VHAPYQQTIMSMASVLDMEYVATTPDEAPGGNIPFADRIRGDSEVVRRFDQLGYDYVYSSPGVFDWGRCDEDHADFCVAPQRSGWNLGEMELSLLELTPLGSLGLAREAITDPAYVVDQLDEHEGRFEAPFFLYAHALTPHGPFRYAEDCSLRGEFAELEDVTAKTERDEDNYVQDVGCLNRLILDAVDRIQADDPDAIIVLASDHGSKFIPDGFKRLEEWRPEAIREELGVLWAAYLPESCRDDAGEIVNSVDTFEVVFACLEGRSPEWSEDRAFIWPAVGTGPQEIEDTDLLDPVP
jgi:hypothetical protein